MKTISPIFTIAICLLLCVSCKQKKNDDNELIYSPSEFNTPISCIAPAQKSDSILFIGLESGGIVQVNTRTDERKVISTKLGRRIYDIIQEDDSTLFLAVRNNGLVKCLYKNNSIMDTTVYKISVKGYYNGNPTKNYAPYDIEMDNEDGTLFLGTSSGVYRLRQDERKNDTLTTIYRPTNHKSFHFGVNQIKVCGDFLFCATDLELVILDKKKERQSPLYTLKKQISHLYLDNKDSILYATSDAIRYEIDIKRMNSDKKNKFVEIIDSIAGKNLFSYVADTSIDRGKWEFCATQINYSNKNGRIPSFKLKERMNPNYRNYLYLGKNFLFFSQGKRLYSLALHQNLKGKSNIIAAHTIGNNAYIISNDNYLYKYTNEKEVEPLGFIGSFDDGENIIQMCSSSNYLWFITDRKHLYKIDLNPSFFNKLPFRRTYKATIDTLIQATLDTLKRDDFKSIFYDKNSTDLYVGSRYRLYIMHDPENANGEKLVKSLDITPKNDLYVTDIGRYTTQGGKKDTIFISSLNHGLIKVTRDSLKEIHSDSFPLKPYKLVALPQGLVVVLDSLSTTNFDFVSSIFYVSDGTQFIIGYNGIGKILRGCIGEMFCLDISFNKAAIAKSIDQDDRILLGSQTGLYEYIGDENFKLIQIPEKPLFSSIEWIIIIVALLLLIWIMGFVYYDNITLKNFNAKLRKYEGSDGKIEKYVPKEHHEKLNKDGIETIRKEFDKLYKQKKLQKLFNWCYNINNINILRRKLNELVFEIDAKQIKREDVIEWNKKFIGNWKKIFEDCEKSFQNEKALEKLEDVKLDKEVSTIISSQIELEKLMDIFIGQIRELGTENKKLTEQQIDFSEKIKDLRSDYQKLILQQGKDSKKIQTFIMSMIEELKNYEDILPDSEKEELKTIQETNDIASVPEALEELKKLLKHLHNEFSQYIHIEDIPSDMREKLHNIFDKNEHDNHIKTLEKKGNIPEDTKAKAKAEAKAKFSYIKSKSESFFTDYRIYFGMCKDWSSTEKAIACCYLHHERISPFHVASELYDEITSHTASDTRRNIHSKLDEISSRNFILEILWNRTLSTQAANKKKNGNKSD
jgi:hypothetical protein